MLQLTSWHQVAYSCFASQCLTVQCWQCVNSNVQYQIFNMTSVTYTKWHIHFLHHNVWLFDIDNMQIPMCNIKYSILQVSYIPRGIFVYLLHTCAICKIPCSTCNSRSANSQFGFCVIRAVSLVCTSVVIRSLVWNSIKDQSCSIRCNLQEVQNTRKFT